MALPWVLFAALTVMSPGSDVAFLVCWAGSALSLVLVMVAVVRAVHLANEARVPWSQLLRESLGHSRAAVVGYGVLLALAVLVLVVSPVIAFA
jgi:hypothetical protein